MRRRPYLYFARIWTQELEKAERYSREIQAGIVSVNNVVASDHRMLEFVNIKSVRMYHKLMDVHHVE